LLEFDFLAPDSVNEMINSLFLFEKFTGKAYADQHEKGKKYSEEKIIDIGKKLLESKKEIVDELNIFADGFENNKRKTRLIKVFRAYQLFKELISYYAVKQLVSHIKNDQLKKFEQVQQSLPARPVLTEWTNVGGQLIPKNLLEKFIQQIDNSNKIKTWEQVHQFYKNEGDVYAKNKLSHSLAALKKVHGIDIKKISSKSFKNLLQQSMITEEWMTKGIYDSRAKDYTNPYRKMVYENADEMNEVTGSLRGNSFIKQQNELLVAYKKKINEIGKKL
jgi:hypothetical protein